MHLNAINESFEAKRHAAAIRKNAEDYLEICHGHPVALICVDGLKEMAGKYDALANRWDKIADMYGSMMLEERSAPCGF